MSKTKSIIKWSLLSILGLAVVLVSFGYWFVSLLPEQISKDHLKGTTKGELPYLANAPKLERGKVLAVVTSTDKMGASGKETGYELTELSRAYYVFEANGFEVDIASPLGGEPPMIIDSEDMGVYDFAFLNDSEAVYKTKNTIAMAEVNPEEYQAIYFVGGKGAMFDFPENANIQAIVREYYEQGKVIGAVCHGPAALVNVTLENGTPLLSNKAVCSFTNQEELFLIPDAAGIFPFLLQSKMEERGARFLDGYMYLQNVAQDEKLVTGQNPWSTWEVAESMVTQMGYQLAPRKVTAEEHTVKVLGIYEAEGYGKAKEHIQRSIESQSGSIDRVLLAKHGIIAGMRFHVGKLFSLVALMAEAKSLSEAS